MNTQKVIAGAAFVTGAVLAGALIEPPLLAGCLGGLLGWTFNRVVWRHL